MMRSEELTVKDHCGQSPLAMLIENLDAPDKKAFWEKLRHSRRLVEQIPTLLQTLDQSPVRDEQIELAQQLIAKLHQKALELKNALDQLNE
jgi:hypothetical protein